MAVPARRLPPPPGWQRRGGGGPRGSLEPAGGKGGGGRRSWPGRAVAAAAAAGAGQTAQPLPPGASLSSPRSWRLQNSLSLSATSLLPLRSLPPRPTPAESPRTGAPRARPASRGLMLPEAGGGGPGGHRGVRDFLGILGMRPCSVWRLLTAARSWGRTGAGLGNREPGGSRRPPAAEPLGPSSPGAGSHRGHEGGARRRGKPPDSRRFPGPGEFPAGLMLGGCSGIPGSGESLNS